ncbi:MAG: hypothetical protein JO301_07255 [Chitinophagaceae bacterium]|nr:hypothetical protein [Chitinophagaceae bacterium]
MLLMLCTLTNAVRGQENGERGQYSLVAYISGGMGHYATAAGTPVAVNPVTSKWGFAGSVRVLWYPDHLLRIGFESGHMTFYSYKFTDSIGKAGKTSVTGVPLLLVASMPITARLNAFFGTGFYNMTTNLDYGGKTDSHKLAVGWMLAASYVQPLSKDLGVGFELKWMDAAQTVDASIVGQLQLVWKFIKW